MNEFEKTYRQLYLPLCMYALRLLGDTAEAEDAVQEAMVAVWERIERGEVVLQLKAYMYRAVANSALMRLRRRPAMTALVDREADLTTLEVSDEDVDTSERDAALWRAIDALPERQREVFLLGKRDGLSHAAIAARLGISTKTVEGLMTHAYKALRHALRPDHGRSGQFPIYLFI